VKNRRMFNFLILSVLGLRLTEISIILNADEFNFINDNSISIEDRKSRINLIDVTRLNSDDISVLIDTCSTSDPLLAICIFKTLQKRDDFRDISLLFIRRRFANGKETDANLSEYLNALKRVYLLENPDSVKYPISIYRNLSLKLSEIMKEASLFNRVLLFTNDEIVNTFLMTGRAEEFFYFLPKLVEHKWSDETTFKKLCGAILGFQRRNYSLPDQLFVNLKNVLSNVNDKEIKDIILLIIQKYEATKTFEQELTVNDLRNTKIDIHKREAKLRQLKRETNGLLFTGNPGNAPIFIEIMFDEKQENQIRKRLIDSLLIEMDKDVNLKSPVIFDLYKTAFEKLKGNPTLFKELVLETPAHYMKASKDMYLSLIIDKNVPLQSRAAVIFNLSYFKRIDKEKIKRIAIQCLEELKQGTLGKEDRIEVEDLLMGTLQEFTGEDINPDMSLEEIKRICR